MPINTNWIHCTYCGKTELIIGELPALCPNCGHKLGYEKEIKRRNKK